MKSSLVVNPSLFENDAAHFGVSINNFVQSSFETGMVATEIIHEGLSIVSPRHRMQQLTGRELFNNLGSESSNDDARLVGETIAFHVPESVEEYCKRRNLSEITVVNVGQRVLSFAAVEDVRPGVDLEVFRNRSVWQKGVLDSILAFTVTPMNMISTERKQAGAWAKAKYKLLGR